MYSSTLLILPINVWETNYKTKYNCSSEIIHSSVGTKTAFRGRPQSRTLEPPFSLLDTKPNPAVRRRGLADSLLSGWICLCWSSGGSTNRGYIRSGRAFPNWLFDRVSCSRRSGRASEGTQRSPRVCSALCSSSSSSSFLVLHGAVASCAVWSFKKDAVWLVVSWWAGMEWRTSRHFLVWVLDGFFVKLSPKGLKKYGGELLRTNRGFLRPLRFRLLCNLLQNQKRRPTDERRVKGEIFPDCAVNFFKSKFREFKFFKFFCPKKSFRHNFLLWTVPYWNLTFRYFRDY